MENESNVKCYIEKTVKLENIHPEIALRKEKIYSKIDHSQRKTKIICTLGPVSYKVDDIIKMLDAGMEIARLNFSHGDHASHKRLVDNIKEALRARPLLKCSILMDTKGPEIRTGLLDGVHNIKLKKDQVLEITTDYSFKGNSNKISCSYPHLTELKPGSIILIADGSISCEVMYSEGNSVFVTVLNDATLSHCKNVNLPGQIVKLPTITEKDENDIVNFAAVYGVDMIAASFVRSPDDVLKIRQLLGDKAKDVQIISKIENQEGMDNFEKILEVSDGIMVARGDLGMEIPTEKIFIAQKYMIDMANIHGKLAITATQMMESMITNPRPTRAEATDVANAVLDGTDCVMLSGETANGLYPLKVIEVMGKICAEAEAVINYPRILNLLYESISSIYPISTMEKACIDCIKTAEENKCDLIVVFTKCGKSVKLISKYRPRQIILAMSYTDKTCRSLIPYRGVKSVLFPPNLNNDIKILQAKAYIGFFKFAKKNDSVLYVIPDNEEDDDSTLITKHEAI